MAAACVRRGEHRLHRARACRVVSWDAACACGEGAAAMEEHRFLRRGGLALPGGRHLHADLRRPPPWVGAAPPRRTRRPGRPAAAEPAAAVAAALRGGSRSGAELTTASEPATVSEPAALPSCSGCPCCRARRETPERQPPSAAEASRPTRRRPRPQRTELTAAEPAAEPAAESNFFSPPEAAAVRRQLAAIGRAAEHGAPRALLALCATPLVAGFGGLTYLRSIEDIEELHAPSRRHRAAARRRLTPPRV